MLNYLWLALVLCAVVLGGIHGELPLVTKKAFDASKDAVMVTALPLVGLMTLWLGIMRLAEKSGFILLIARALKPLMRWLFPDVPSEHPAIGCIVMTMAANMLGLGNSATPLGLKAMQELEKLNPRPGTATNAMCTFLAISTSSIQLIPASVIAILAANGSQNPTAIIGTSLIACICATIAAIVCVKLLENLPGYRLAPLPLKETPKEESQTLAPESSEKKLPSWAYPIMAIFLIAFFYAGWKVMSQDTHWKTIFALPLLPMLKQLLLLLINAVSVLAVPFFLTFFPLYAALKRIPVYEEFIEGAKEGFNVGIRIIPYLVAILVAIGMFRAAGGIDLLAKVLAPVLSLLHFPVDLLPLAVVRPLSGSGALGIFTEIVQAHGPDTLISRMAATIMGGTETTFYVLALYFGSVAVKRTRHAVPAGLCADLTGMVVAVLICNLVFGTSSPL